jgi:predicted phosphodiesterase
VRRVLTRARVVGAAALVGVFVLVTLVASVSAFRYEARTVTIGAHTTIVRPAFDGYATFDLGPLVPHVRVPVDTPFGLGVSLDVGDSVEATRSIEQLIQRDALIASQPAGEVRRLRSAMGEMAVDALVRGAGFGLLTVVLVGGTWRVVGPRRRRELLQSARTAVRDRRHWHLLTSATVLAGLVVGVGAIVAPATRDPAVPGETWIPIGDLIPQVELEGSLARIEIAESAVSSSGVAVLDSALDAYAQSAEFYGRLTEAVPDVADQLREPEEGETVALIVSDRHDNIGMDPVARAIGDAGGATVLIDAGDDTSSGGSWESFSVNSLADAFEGYTVVAVAGNHDPGDQVVQQYEDSGFTVLDGEPVEVEGTTFLGERDPRESGLTAARIEEGETIEEQGERLADVACEAGDVDVFLVHDRKAGLATAERGCAALVLSGHYHRQIGPETVEGDDGRVATTFTNGTTGGATYAFALGTELRTDAQVTLVTFDEEGAPVGLQPVTITTAGTIRVADYSELPEPGHALR